MDRTVACYQSHAAELRTARFHIEHQSSEPADAGGYLGKTMAYRTLANSVAAFSLLFAVTFADEAQQLPKKPRVKKLAPVQLSARLLKTESKSKNTVEISLTIGYEYEIYAARKHEFLMPLEVELLDKKLQPIKSKFVFPKPTTIPFDKDLGGGASDGWEVFHSVSVFQRLCQLLLML